MSVENFHFVGIDPGKSTGFAVVRNGEFVKLESLTFWEAYDQVVLSFAPNMVGLIVVEISTATYVWHGKGKASIAKAARTGQHVGAVRREGELLAERFESQGFVVRRTQPKGKLDAERFALLTGYTEQTNEHKRDAGVMAYMAWNEARALGRVAV